VANIPTPLFRELQIFALDPSLGSSLKTYELRTDTIHVRYERRPKGQSTLKPGPVGEYLEVVDIDPASNRFYAPVNLDDPRILASDGLHPSEGNPQFHQQMVYAVAMRTIDVFEQALGRKVLWQPSRPGPDAKNDEWIYVPRLRLYPHALRAQNAFYSPDRRAILFGYFPSEASDDALTPGGTMVFSCLSSDVIAHEMTHAILDGAARGYREDSNPDVFAFHEAFADIVALFEHFMYPTLVASEIARARGTSAMDLLAGLARHSERIEINAGREQQREHRRERPAIGLEPVPQPRFPRARNWHWLARYQGLDAVAELGPPAVRRAAAPAPQIRTLDLVERHWRQRFVDLRLHKLAGISREIGFGADPLGLGCGLRPQDYDSARLFQVSLNDFRIGSVGGKVGVPPDIAPGRLQRLGDTASDRFVGSRIADEYVPFSSSPLSVSPRVAVAQPGDEDRLNRTSA